MQIPLPRTGTSCQHALGTRLGPCPESPPALRDSPAGMPRTLIAWGVHDDATRARLTALAERATCVLRFVRLNPDEILKEVTDAGVGLLMLDGMDSAALVRAIQAIQSHIPGHCVLGAYRRSDVRRIVEAMQAGAADCIALDADDPDSVESLKGWVERAACRAPACAMQPVTPFGAFKTLSPRLAAALARLRNAAESDETVLLEGATGTGKTLLASEIHAASRRAGGPFVEVSCAALSPALLESELFGHVRGAFTGATCESFGKAGAAEGGTLFLDEIDSMSPEMQGKLLRLLQSRAYEPVGGHKTRLADVRFVAATNADLRERIRSGQFREDLFYRLGAVRFQLPPLSERTGDIPILTDHFLRGACARTGRRIREFSPSALAALCRHDWPGNVRELENAVRGAVLAARGEVIELEDLPMEFAAAAGGSSTGTPRLRARVEEAERQTILEALRRAGNRRTAAAIELGITRITLYNKMRKLGIRPALTGD